MQRALVTGGAGFIGAHLVRALLEQNVEVRVLDNFSTGSRAALEGLDVDLRLEDLRNESALESAVSGCDVIFHLAAMISVPVSMEDPLTCYDINCSGSVSLFKAASRAGVHRVVLASSSAVYGEVEGEVYEDTVLNPQSPYASSKLAMEQAGFMFVRAFDMEISALRCFNVYGPGQSPDSAYAAAIPLFIRALLSGETPVIFGSGEQTRTFVYVEDVIQANILAATHPEFSGQVFNIAGNQTVSILQLLEKLQSLLPDSKLPKFAAPRPGDIVHSVANIDKASTALGYRPAIALREGLKSTIEWFQDYSDRKGS
ncbi:MAG: NAD-dependent epimerase/dehydratase family protein [Anaerolineales bacterium]|nr:NAD-dependent epimerase/dehydratase family protein [Anaerolineales bacterium]